MPTGASSISTSAWPFSLTLAEYVLLYMATVTLPVASEGKNTLILKLSPTIRLSI